MMLGYPKYGARMTLQPSAGDRKFVCMCVWCVVPSTPPGSPSVLENPTIFPTLRRFIQIGTGFHGTLAGNVYCTSGKLLDDIRKFKGMPPVRSDEETRGDPQVRNIRFPFIGMSKNFGIHQDLVGSPPPPTPLHYLRPPSSRSHPHYIVLFPVRAKRFVPWQTVSPVQSRALTLFTGMNRNVFAMDDDDDDGEEEDEEDDDDDDDDEEVSGQALVGEATCWLGFDWYTHTVPRVEVRDADWSYPTWCGLDPFWYGTVRYGMSSIVVREHRARL